MRLLRSRAHREQVKRSREQQVPLHHSDGFIVRSAEGARFSYSERPLPRPPMEEAGIQLDFVAEPTDVAHSLEEPGNG